MVEREPEDREGFLRRWSRRKALRATEPAPLDDPDQAAATAEPLPSAEVDADAPFDVASLPDIETLHAGSDFKAFLQQGVPQELRTMALRKLWRLNPAYGHLDGLVDYGEDYRTAGTLLGKLKTAYQVGKGFVRDEKADAPADEPAPELPPGQQPDHAQQAARIEDAAEPQVETVPDRDGEEAPASPKRS